MPPTTTATAAPDRYKWIALSNTTLGVLMATINSSILLIALPDIFRGHPHRPARARQHQLPALDDPRLPRRHGRARRQPRPARRHLRPRADVQPRLRRLHVVLDPALGHVDARRRGRDVADRHARGAGHRRRDAVRQLGAILTDAFPADQRGLALGINGVAAIAGSFIGLVLGGLLAPIAVAAGVPRVRADRRVRDGLGLPQAPRPEPAPPGAHRLVGQRHLRRRASSRSWSGSPTASSRTAGTRWAGPRPGVLGRADRRPRAPGRLRVDRAARGRADVPPLAVPHPRVHRRQHGDAARRHRPRRPAVHPHHLAAGDLAARATATRSPRRRSGRASTCCR